MISSIDLLHLESPSIEIERLPWLAFASRQSLPAASGVYFLLGDRSLQYIGVAHSLSSRLVRSHHHFATLRQMDQARIAWLEVEDIHDCLPEVEARLIDRFRPPLNPFRHQSTVALLGHICGNEYQVHSVGSDRLPHRLLLTLPLPEESSRRLELQRWIALERSPIEIVLLLESWA